ncbi:hypothetical protein RUM43_009505 [Polyplax serrata]|uniref:Cysteine-rich motor neuron 1 protein n=1 Tax=Polyplax serrata TaxID=468196 RepID=A0AAN8PAV9_POLSC
MSARVCGRTSALNGFIIFGFNGGRFDESRDDPICAIPPGLVAWICYGLASYAGVPSISETKLKTSVALNSWKEFETHKNCSDVICPDEVEKCPEDSYRLPAYKSPEDCCLTPQNCKCLPRECKQRVCPPGQHPKIVRPGNGRPGTCCPLYDCISDKKLNDSCLVNNSHHMENGTTWQKDPCTICSCLNGYLFCKASTSGNCTENPAGCMSSSAILHQNGETWEEDPCTQCTCESGEKKCVAFMCVVPCSNPVHVPGECCPICNESSVVILPPECPDLNNCSLRCLHGFVRDKSDCYKCECEAEPCLLECLHGFAHDSTGHLLCQCAEPEPTSALTTTTTNFDCPSAAECRKFCSYGPLYSKEGCEKCKCRTNLCKPLTDCKKICSNGFALNEKGCPICTCQGRFSDETTMVPSDRNHASNCFGNDGFIRDDGETWHDGCRQCLCHGGVEMCNLVVCPRLNCVNPIFNSSTDCCAICPDDLKSGNAPVKTLLCHSLDGSYKKEGEMWSIDPCTNCICHMGQILCDTRECPPTPCQSPITDSEHCCPYCPQDSSIVESEGKYCDLLHSHGSVWKKSSCESCKCVDGETICYTQECDLDNCPHPVLQKNQCCSICLGKSTVESNLTVQGRAANPTSMHAPPVTQTSTGKGEMSQRSCRVGDSIFHDSDRWMEDECTVCVCNDGQTMCTKQLCSSVHCDNPVMKPGRCCPMCPDRDESLGFKGNPVKTFVYNIIITILSLVVLGLLVCILIQCRRSRRYCVSCPDSESLPSFKSLSKSKFKYNSNHSEYAHEKAKLASV